jgi:hypothetical protein
MYIINTVVKIRTNISIKIIKLILNIKLCMIQKGEANPIVYCTVKAVLLLLPIGGSSTPQHQHISQLPFSTP